MDDIMTPYESQVMIWSLKPIAIEDYASPEWFK